MASTTMPWGEGVLETLYDTLVSDPETPHPAEAVMLEVLSARIMELEGVASQRFKNQTVDTTGESQLADDLIKEPDFDVAEVDEKTPEESEEVIVSSPKSVLTKMITDPCVVLLLTHLCHFATPTRHALLNTLTKVFRDPPSKPVFVASVLKNRVILDQLVCGCANRQYWAGCGNFLRVLVRSEKIASALMHTHKLFSAIVALVENREFDIAANAFDTLKTLLRKHPKLTGKYLNKNFEEMCVKFDHMTSCRTYITKVHSLHLLGSILLNKSNFKFMIKFINRDRSLRRIIDLFVGSRRSKGVRGGSFTVLKIFVANPKKKTIINDILVEHRDELLQAVNEFTPATNIQKFEVDKKRFIMKLGKLKQPKCKSPEHVQSDEEHRIYEEQGVEKVQVVTDLGCCRFFPDASTDTKTAPKPTKTVQAAVTPQQPVAKKLL